MGCLDLDVWNSKMDHTKWIKLHQEIFFPYVYHFVSGYLGLSKDVPSYVLPFMNVACTLIWQSYTTFDHTQISLDVKQLMLYISEIMFL